MRQIGPFFGLVLLLSSLFIGCGNSDDDDFEIIDDKTASNTVYFLNEGNFGWGVGTVDMYQLNDKKVTKNIFQKTNGRPIGNVLQSAISHKNSYFFAVNNSNKVVVCDRKMKVEKEITDINSPRNLYPIDNNKMYVTSLYGNGIYVINLETNNVIKKIPINGWTEGGFQTDEGFWVCNNESKYLFLVDDENDVLKDSIELKSGMTQIQIDNRGQAWILGKESQSGDSYLLKVDLKNKSIINQISVTGSIYPKIEYLKKRDIIFLLSDKLYYIEAMQDDMQTQILFEKDDTNWYGMFVYKFGNSVFISDAKDYVKNSTTYHISSDGELIYQFETGIITNGGLELTE
jgi:YVTN family beta-propeller protein